MGRGTRVRGGVVVGVAVAGVVGAWALTAGPLQGSVEGTADVAPDYGSGLVRYDTGTGQRFFALPDGDAALAYGSPDRHRVVVQFRDPDGEGWTSPTTVYRDDATEAVDEVIRYGGGTLAIAQGFVPPDAGEDDSDLDTVVLTCGGSTCSEAVRVDGFVLEPQVAADGLTALFASEADEVLRWIPERGVRWDRVRGVPDPSDLGTIASEPLLSPDGGLRLVTGSLAGGECDLRLLAAGRDGRRLAEVARTSVPGGPRAHSCETSLETFSTEWVQVQPESDRAARFWFLREEEDGEWARGDEDPSGLERLAGRAYEGLRCCELVRLGAVLGWNELGLGSPDGRSLSVQAHFLGEQEWEPRQLIEGAPEGYRCTTLDGSDEYGDRFVALLTCHSGRIRNPDDGDAVAVAATDDLRTWRSVFVADLDVRPTVTDDAIVASGERLVVWEEGEDPQTVDLPTPDGSATTRAEDGTLVQARSRRDGDTCRVELVVAGADERAWSDPIPSTVPPLSKPECRIDAAYSLDGGAQFLLDDRRRGTFLEVLPDGDGWAASVSRSL